MSIRIALTGLRASSSELSISADNIANSNTTGFKEARAELADIVAGNGRGAGNTIIGDGVQLTAVTQQFNQGNITFTGNPLDLAVSGEGFFRVNDGGSILYTRAGAFSTDQEGFVINSLGQRLTGFGADAAGNINGVLGDMRVSTADVAPNQTTEIEIRANLNAAATAPALAFDPTDPTTFNDATSLTFFDSLGAAHTATLFFRKTAANTWQNLVTVDGAQIGGANAMTFDTSGSLTAPAGGVFTTASFTPPGAAAMTLDLNVADVTQFGTQFGVNFLAQDGFTNGQLAGLEVEDSGILFGRYSNGESLALGQVTLASFTNQQGMTRVGESNWAESFRSGPPLIGEPGSATLGIVQSGALEDSNVELTEQLVLVINAQRNFQANAQVITASDQLTQTVLNIS